MKKNILNLTDLYLAYFAKIIYNRFRPYVIGITGSTGKTTTRYMLSQIGVALGRKNFSSSGNLNTQIGLPLAVLGFSSSPKGIIGYLSVLLRTPFKAIFMKKYPRYLILEYGIDKPGDMEELTNLISPDVAVITNIGVAHIGAFKKIENIGREKWQLALSAKDYVFCFKKVADLQKSFGEPKAQIITPESSDTRAKNINYMTNKTEFDLVLNSKTYKAEFGFSGKHNLDNLILAVLVASKVFVGDEKIAQALKDLFPLSGRGERFVGRSDILVIDESYNANPVSMAAALNNLDHIKLGRKVVIMGEMKEIDPIKKVSHEKVADLARQKADFLIGVGDGYKSLNLDKWYEDVEQLELEIDSLLKSGDVLLVKGSLAVGLQKIIDKMK